MRKYGLVVRDEAQQETENIKAWYEQQKPGLGDRFTDALESAYVHLRGNPFYQVRKGIFRYAQIEGFPSYRIVYAVDDMTITVYQVRHTSRRPDPTFGP